MRIPLLLLAAFPVCVASAQPTIEYSDVSPSGLSSDLYLLTDPSELTAITDGAAQDWDLGSASLVQVGSMHFTPSAGTPYANDYPQANWAWVESTPLGTDHVYLDISAAQVDIWAMSVPSDPNVYTNPSKIMAFPLDHGDSFGDSYTDSNGSSDIVWSYAGYGTLTLSAGVFTDIVKMTSDEGDLILWNTAPLYPVLYYEGSGAVLVFAQNDAGVAEAPVRALRTAPNPCSDMLVVRDAAPASRWSIMDAQGRLVRQGRWSTIADGRVPVADLTAGTYLLVVDDGATVGRSTFVKE